MNIKQQMKNWEQKFESLKDVTKLENPSSLEKFKNLLSRYWSEDQDSFLYSLAYYIFTGRNGAWLYWGIDSVCVVCWHPNIPGKILVYPHIGSNKGDPLPQLLSSLPKTPAGVQIAKVPSGLEITGGKKITEPVLDWAYPVHVISTSKALEKHGHDLYYVRRHAKKIDDSKVSLKPFSPRDISALYKVSQKYTHKFLLKHEDFALSHGQMLSPNLDIISRCIGQPDIYKAATLWYMGEPEGLFVWDEVSSTTANCIWFLHNKEIPGISYKQMLLVCEMLKERGIENLNLGGSETEGMDFFKTRFRPVQSFSFKSIVIEENANQQFQTLKEVKRKQA